MDCTIIVKVYKGIFTGFNYDGYYIYIAVVINIFNNLITLVLQGCELTVHIRVNIVTTLILQILKGKLYIRN